ncbi:MAG: DUF6208 family protein [Cyanobacteria bacterium P01_G01_bin.39]
MNNIWLLWEIPLALLSLLFNKVMKLAIGILFTIYLALNKKKASQWRVLSQKMINAPLILPVLMTKGPRWNTHAVIGTLGPFKVSETIAIDLETANKSSRSWIAVVYSFPGYKTIASVESERISTDSSWHILKLPAGKYSLGVRYYNRNDTIDYPAIKVDDRLFVESYNVPQDINSYYDNLIEAKNWFYSGLHYYIFTLLKLRQYLPESFIRREYLPVGAPATHFAYNYLDKQQALKIETTPEIIEQFDIYFTLYDRSSLPITWCIITESKYALAPQGRQGYYLLRVRPKPDFFDTKLQVYSEISQLEELSQQLNISSQLNNALS